MSVLGIGAKCCEQPGCALQCQEPTPPAPPAPPVIEDEDHDAEDDA